MMLVMAEAFLPGLRLSRLFYDEAVRPLLDDAFPHLRYSAARIGGGSEVLGFDTARSADHEWGPRLQLLVRDTDGGTAVDVSEMLAARLPGRFRGWPTNFGPADAEIRAMQPADGPVAHRVQVVAIGTWLQHQLGFDPRAGVSELDWLSTPWQRLAETVGGAVFHDGLGEVRAVRERLAWYPDDVWRFVLAVQWRRVADEEAFPGRCAEVGDDIGAAVVVARLVRDVMRLCLLCARRYPPYSKWLGSAFAALACAEQIGPSLRGALTAAPWPDREAHLVQAYRKAAGLHNELGLTAMMDPEPRPFFDRPFLVIDGARFAEALREGISSPTLRARPLVGAADQFLDSTPLLCDPAHTRTLAAAALADGADSL